MSLLIKMKTEDIGKNKSNEEIVWYLIVLDSGASSANISRVDVTEMILRGRRPNAGDIGRFAPDYVFKPCFHSPEPKKGIDFEYCGWLKDILKYSPNIPKAKHDCSDPCWRAKVTKHTFAGLKCKFVSLEGRIHAVWKKRIPVPIYGSLNEYFAEKDLS